MGTLSRSSLFAAGLVATFVSAGAWGQTAGTPPALPGGAVLPMRPGASPALKLGKQKGNATSSAEATGAAVLPKNSGGLPPPKIPGATSPGAAGSGVRGPGATGGGAAAVQGEVSAAEDVEEVFSFKSNFEKDVKCQPLPLNARISVDFEEAPLYDVVKFMACITQRNYLIASNLKQAKTVTILSTTPVTVYEAYKAFLAALDINGLTVVPAGKFFKIVDSAKSKNEILPIYGSKQAVPNEDRPITRVIRLNNIDVKDIEAVLAKFKTPSGDIASYQPGNSLIVTDLGRNVVRMLKFVNELDIPTGREKIWVRPVQNASAADMAQLVTGLFGEKTGGAKGGARPTTAKGAAKAAEDIAGLEGADGPATLSKVIADERTNQLILVATPTAYLKIDRLLRRIDLPIEGEGQIHIYYLENASAEDVSSTLTSLTSGSSGKGAKGAAKGAASGGSANLFEGTVKITAHKPTNSLVIESTLKDYMAVKRVIQQLDVRRKQVYVEAVIMEISSNHSRKLGVSGSGGMTFNIGGNTVPFLFGLGGLGMSALDLTQLTKGGLAMGLQGPLVDVSTGSTGSSSTSGALSIPSYGFMIQAIQTNSDVNVLSTPHLLTMDNEEAEIVVGKQIPYQASSMGGMSSLLSSYGGLTGALGGSSAATSTSALGALGSLSSMGGLGNSYVQRIDVDLTLKITPQISESNHVRLKIQQSIDDVESMDATLGPTTSKRKVTNTVVVRDQQPVVIGGLVRDIEIVGVDKIPVLGDIPLLGILFRRTDKRVEKRNLLMVITPYIIEDPSDLQRIHDQKMDEMNQFAEYMAVKQKESGGRIDYRKKTSVVDDIRSTMERVRKDREMLEQTRFEEVDQVGPAQTHDLEYDPFGSGDEGAALDAASGSEAKTGTKKAAGGDPLPPAPDADD